MTLTTAITYEEFQTALQDCKRAWHIEMQDSYNVESEDKQFQDFLDDRPDDYKWLTDWLRFIRELKQSGTAVERARIVSVPHTDYSRWGLAVATQLTAAGEDIRYLERKDSRDIAFPSEDFWLLDDNRVILSVFFDGGRHGGFARATDPDLIEKCRAVRDQVWARAIPFELYSTPK